MYSVPVKNYYGEEQRMDESREIEYLMHFGLSRQEALIYRKLLEGGKKTGYEIARDTGISRSNEGDAKRYIPIVPQEFCGNRIRRLEKELEWLQQNLPSESVEEDGYITVEGKKNIADKIHHLLTGAEERVYFSCSKGCLEEFKEELLQLVRRGKKVVLITDESFPMKEVIVYVTRKKEQQIGLIVDSRYVLSGEYGMGSMNTCVYSGQRNFVTVFKNALANEIELIKIRKGEKKDEQETICYKGTG